jgi:hypothetical protein
MAEAPTNPSVETGSSNGDKHKSIAEVGRTMPANYLAVGKDSIPYDLRVQAIERGGLPDVLVDTAEGQPPGHYGEGSPIRSEINKLLTAAAVRLAQEEQSSANSQDGQQADQAPARRG